MTIAVDFDGTIVEHRYPNIGKELPFAIETLKKLADGGHRIILWSVREGKLLDDAVKYCIDRGLELYAVNSEYPGASWTGSGASRKVTADIYIDDRNLGGIPDWNMIYEMVTNHLTYADMLERMKDEENEVVIYDGTFRSHSSHRKHRRSLWSRIVDRCYEARFKYRH